MSKIVFLDTSDLAPGVNRRRPLGGKESCVINLADALVAKGREVHIVTNNDKSDGEPESGIRWHYLGQFQASMDSIGTPDLFIANNSAEYIFLAEARKYAVWLHNHPKQLWKRSGFYRKFLRSSRVARTKFLVSGSYHYSQWTKNRYLRKFLCRIIPLAVTDDFIRHREKRDTVPDGRTVVHLSDPRRGLESVLALWVGYIHGSVPDAELHVYGSATEWGISQSASVMSGKSYRISLASALENYNVHVKEPVGADSLPQAIKDARLIMYMPGRVEETFCLCLAETQTLGIPAVVGDGGALGERVDHGRTGFVESDSVKLGRRAVELLTDDDLWLKFHTSTFAQPTRSWSDYADDLIDSFDL